MKKFGLIGYPLGHSFSPGYFNEKFQNEGIEAVYERYELKSINELQEVISANPELMGLNVTKPYKEKVMQYLDYVSPDAMSIGAVNVIKVEHKGEGVTLKGYNTDAPGFQKSIESMLYKHHRKALILGTGGASKAIDHALHKLGIETVIVSRSQKVGTIQYSQITPALVREYEVIVNCTPCGMSPNFDECPILPYEALTPDNILYDLIYNPDETLFLRKGREHGAVTKNGLEMLLLQADYSWEIWNS